MLGWGDGYGLDVCCGWGSLCEYCAGGEGEKAGRAAVFDPTGASIITKYYAVILGTFAVVKLRSTKQSRFRGRDLKGGK